MPKVDFATLVFQGARFEGATIPVEVLSELVAYRNLVLAVAREIFFSENPARVRTPKGFESSFELILDGVMEGSAIPNVARRTDAMFVEGDVFFRARDIVEDGIAAASAGTVLPRILSREVLTRFSAFGRTLLETEKLIVGKPHRTGGATYDRATRHELLRLSMADYEDDVDLIGVVREADKDAESFALRTNDGRRVEVRSSPMFFPLIAKMFTNDRTVRLRGTGIYDATGTLQRVVTTTDVAPSEEETDEPLAGCPTPLQNQIEKLANLPDGWYDADSRRYDRDQLAWLRATLEAIIQTFKLPTPYVYPMPDGSARAEWTVGGSEVIAELDLSERTGYVVVARVDSGSFIEHTVRFGELGAESDFGSFIAKELGRSDA